MVGGGGTRLRPGGPPRRCHRAPARAGSESEPGPGARRGADPHGRGVRLGLPGPGPNHRRGGGVSPDERSRAMSAAGAPPPEVADVALAPLSRAQRDDVREILEATAVFREDEVAVALEVLDSYFDHP